MLFEPLLVDDEAVCEAGGAVERDADVMTSPLDAVVVIITVETVPPELDWDGDVDDDVEVVLAVLVDGRLAEVVASTLVIVSVEAPVVSVEAPVVSVEAPVVFVEAPVVSVVSVEVGLVTVTTVLAVADPCPAELPEDVCCCTVVSAVLVVPGCC